MEELTTIQSKIYEIRGQRVMLDFDLAALYQVETRVLKQAVRRNIERFPSDFMFELTADEFNSLKDSLRSQFVISNKGGIRYMPFAFTEQGVAMLSSVLKSAAAIQTNIAIMRAFVAMRNYIMTTSTITAELSEIRAKLALLERADEDNAEAVNDPGQSGSNSRRKRNNRSFCPTQWKNSLRSKAKSMKSAVSA